MLEDYIERLKPYVNELFKEDSSGHDISHLVRVMNNALYIQEKEGGDRVIIGISAFLHDVHRIMENEINSPNKEYVFVSPKDSIPKVKEILSNIDLTEEQVNKICFCIEHHEEYNWNGNDGEDYLNIIKKLQLSEESNPTFGYGRGYVPTIQYYQKSTLKDACVSFNDALVNEGDHFVVSQSYYTQERVENLPFLKNSQIVTIHNRFDIWNSTTY